MARGKIDTVGLLYIVGGIPLMGLTFILIFMAVRYLGLPA